MVKILYAYLDESQEKHRRFDLGISVALSCVALVVLYQAGVTSVHLITGMVETIDASVTGISILAGFNLTTLSIFATSSSPVVTKLKSTPTEGKKRQIEQVYAYFSWSVVAQLVVLLVSIIVVFFAKLGSGSTELERLGFTKYVATNSVPSSIMWLATFLVIVSSIYSVMLTIRNITILHDFLIADARITK